MTSDELSGHLDVLGLRLGAEIEEARAARRELLKQWHPDRFPSGSTEWRRATRQSQEINQAFQAVERGLAFGVAAPTPGDPRDWPSHPGATPDGHPVGFRDLAWRLRAGARPLDLRNEIVARERIPKVTAARRVENVQRTLRAARWGLLSGALWGLVALLQFVIGSAGLANAVLYGLFALAQIVPAWLAFRAARPPSDN